MKNLIEIEMFCAEVAVPIPVQGLFTYRIPEALKDKAKPGVRVRVPFRNREIVGYLVEASTKSPEGKIKEVLEILDEEPVLSSSMLSLTKQISDYYSASWGETIENAMPKWVKYGKKAARALKKQVADEILEDSKEAIKDFKLSEDQQTAFDRIKIAITEKQPKPILLFGITGSGKSEVYIRSIREVVAQGKSAICLVPEIALTEQIRRFFLKHFGSELEILHSKLTDSERFLAWKRIETGKRHVILGPRSAVFAPVQNLGLLIMDEEHETSYKQETTPRYHAREVACWRSKNENALFIMGTATPSLETMRTAKKGGYERLDLRSRIDNRELPSVQVIDFKDVIATKSKNAILSHKLSHEIEANLQRKEGTMLLLNRRGFSTNINCPKCGHIESCNACQVSLTFHHEDGSLLCHYCNLKKKVPQECPECGDRLLRFAGFGTEKVESEVARCFPTARIARMDTDSIRKRGSHEEILSKFRNQEIDILIGTQMIAKGFDFPHVTLVGVVQADVGLMLPDFRSAERTFHLLTQVAGRAGRGTKKGKVIVQTFSPQHPSIRFAKDHDYQKFYDHEISERLRYCYPPTHHLINIIVRSKDEKKAYLFARSAREALQSEFADLIERCNDTFELVGPAPLPFYKLRGHFRWHLMLKANEMNDLPMRVTNAMGSLKKTSLVAYVIDVDPLNIL